MANKKRTPFLRLPAVQTLLASLICILLGLVVGYIVLLCINPAGAWEAITDIVRTSWALPVLCSSSRTWATPWLRRLRC